MSDRARWRLFGEVETAENWLVTTAIGGDYFERWVDFARDTWLRYARQHGLGVAVAVSDLMVDDELELNGAWQKLLALRSLREALGRHVRCAIIDTDVLISDGAPNVFDAVGPRKVGIVSQVRGIPIELAKMNNRIAYLRATFIDPEFPLVSLLNASPSQLFEWAGLSPVLEDYACSGVIVADTASHAEEFARWYSEAPQTPEYLALGDWEQTYLNHQIQQLPEVQWMPYQWQALWGFEVAAYYPFLYSQDCPRDVAQWCLSASLSRNHFVHMAGQWESALLEQRGPEWPGLAGAEVFLRRLREHEESEATAVMRGKIQPPTT